MELTSKKKQLILCLTLVVLASLIIYLLGKRITSEDVFNLVKKAGLWAPLLYIFLFALTHIIAPLSATPIYFAGYALFTNKVQIYTYLATCLSAAVNFWIAKKWGRSFVAKLVGKKDMSKIDHFIRDHGLKTLIFLRLTQGHLVDFISYAYGLTNMNFTPYFLVTALAPIPWLLLWQFYIFPRVDNIGDFTAWFVITLFPFLLISWFFFRYKANKKN